MWVDRQRRFLAKDEVKPVVVVSLRDAELLAKSHRSPRKVHASARPDGAPDHVFLASISRLRRTLGADDGTREAERVHSRSWMFWLPQTQSSEARYCAERSPDSAIEFKTRALLVRVPCSQITLGVPT